MTHRNTMIPGLLITLIMTFDAFGQTSSLGAKKRQENLNRPVQQLSREAPPQPSNKVYVKHSWISVPPLKPKTFSPGDLLTIIVREKRQWIAKTTLNAKKELDIASDLNAFIKLTGGGIGASAFRRGKPIIDYQLEMEQKGKGDAQRRDSLITRLTVKVIDVKPNGLLVFEGRAKIAHDDEVSVITLTGTCRKEDVTANNTILSTQIADKILTITNSGTLRNVTKRGWFMKILDMINPF